MREQLKKTGHSQNISIWHVCEHLQAFGVYSATGMHLHQLLGAPRTCKELLRRLSFGSTPVKPCTPQRNSSQRI